jgi:hypothetical protein
MKKITMFMTYLLVVAAVFANQPTQTAFTAIEKHPLFGPLGNPEFERTAREAAYNAKFAKSEVKSFDATQHFNRPELAEEKVQTEVSLKSRMDELWPKFDRHNPEARNLGKSPTAIDYYRWDSIVLHNPDGSKNSVLAMTFQVGADGWHYPHTMTIRELPSRRLMSERYYDWHTEGPLRGKLKEQRDGDLIDPTTWDAVRYVFHYNAQGLEDTVYQYHTRSTPSNLNWRLIKKEVNDFDANGNVEKVTVWQELHSSGQPTGEWIVSAVGAFTWHADRTLKNRKVWSWGYSFITQRSQWLGIQEETAWFMGSNTPTLHRNYTWEFTNDANATNIHYLTDYGVPTEGKWIGDAEIICNFILSPFGPLKTLEQWNFYNVDNDDWNGNYLLAGNIVQYNRKENYEYDAAHSYRQTSEWVERLVGSEWARTHASWTKTWNWTQNPNTDPNREWDWEVAIVGVFHGPILHWDPPLLPGEDFLRQIDSIRLPKFVKHFSVQTPRIALRDLVLGDIGTENEGGIEHRYKFDQNNKQIEWKISSINIPTQSRSGIYLETIERDECGNATISRHYRCYLGHTGENFEDWGMTRKWVYEHTCDGFRTYQFGFDDEEMTIPWVTGCRRIFLNHDIPVSDMIVWPDRYGDPASTTENRWFPYLVEEVIRFEGYNATTMADVNQYVETYHYTIVNPASNQGITIEGQKATVTVFPNPVQDVLFIQTEDVVKHIYVFSMAGKLVMQVAGNRNSIDLSSLPTGHYVARIHTDKAVVPVRVLKQ